MCHEWHPCNHSSSASTWKRSLEAIFISCIAVSVFTSLIFRYLLGFGGDLCLGSWAGSFPLVFLPTGLHKDSEKLWPATRAEQASLCGQGLGNQRQVVTQHFGEDSVPCEFWDRGARRLLGMASGCELLFHLRSSVPERWMKGGLRVSLSEPNAEDCYFVLPSFRCWHLICR